MKPIITFITITVVLSASRPSPATTIIVDNSLDTSTGSQTTSGNVGSPMFFGQGFAMGGTAESLGTIAAAVNAGASLSLYNETNAGPTSLVTNLTDTGTHNAHGDEIYTPNSPTTLQASHSYMVVMGGAGNSWSITTGPNTNNLATMEADDWVTFSSNPASGWFELSQGNRLQIQVNEPAVAAVPEIGAGSAASALAVLGCAVAMLRGRRWHFAHSSN